MNLLLPLIENSLRRFCGPSFPWEGWSTPQLQLGYHSVQGSGSDKDEWASQQMLGRNWVWLPPHVGWGVYHLEEQRGSKRWSPGQGPHSTLEIPSWAHREMVPCLTKCSPLCLSEGGLSWPNTQQGRTQSTRTYVWRAEGSCEKDFWRDLWVSLCYIKANLTRDIYRNEHLMSSMVILACSPVTQETEARWLRVQGQNGLHNEFENLWPAWAI